MTQVDDAALRDGGGDMGDTALPYKHRFAIKTGIAAGHGPFEFTLDDRPLRGVTHIVAELGSTDLTNVTLTFEPYLLVYEAEQAMIFVQDCRAMLRAARRVIAAQLGTDRPPTKAALVALDGAILNALGAAEET